MPLWCTLSAKWIMDQFCFIKAILLDCTVTLIALACCVKKKMGELFCVDTTDPRDCIYTVA